MINHKRVKVFTDKTGNNIRIVVYDDKGHHHDIGQLTSKVVINPIVQGEPISITLTMHPVEIDISGENIRYLFDNAPMSPKDNEEPVYVLKTNAE